MEVDRASMDEDVCWICIDGEMPDRKLVSVCSCPRKCHAACLARWQLQQAGRREERYCRFCQQEYPDWKHILTPAEIKPTTPIMAVSVRGRVHKLRVKPGPEGKEDFKRQVRQLLGYDDSMEFDVIFECKTPHNGEKVQLHGFSAFDAATHCAAVSAAKRMKNKAAKLLQHANSAAGGYDAVPSATPDTNSIHGLPAPAPPASNSSVSATSGTAAARHAAEGALLSSYSAHSRLNPDTPAAAAAAVAAAAVADAPSADVQRSAALLEAQYRTFLRRQRDLRWAQHQHQLAQAAAVSARTPQYDAPQCSMGTAAAAAGAANMGWSSSTPLQPAAEGAASAANTGQWASHSLPCGSGAGAGAATYSAHQLQLNPPGRSISSASADASAVLTTTASAVTAETAGSSSTSSSGSFVSLQEEEASPAAALASQGPPSCPLSSTLYAACSVPSGDAAGGATWPACTSLSEPLPVSTVAGPQDITGRCPAGRVAVAAANSPGSNIAGQRMSFIAKYGSQDGGSSSVGGDPSRLPGSVTKPQGKLTRWLRRITDRRG